MAFYIADAVKEAHNIISKLATGGMQHSYATTYILPSSWNGMGDPDLKSGG